jgi:predicted HTH domain antitoxin
VARLYRDGQISLREVAHTLGLDLVAAMNLLLDHGIQGNLSADDVLQSAERFDV